MQSETYRLFLSFGSQRQKSFVPSGPIKVNLITTECSLCLTRVRIMSVCPMRTFWWSRTTCWKPHRLGSLEYSVLNRLHDFIEEAEFQKPCAYKFSDILKPPFFSYLTGRLCSGSKTLPGCLLAKPKHFHQPDF